MSRPIDSARLRLAPLTVGDEDWLLGLLRAPEVRLYLCDDRMIARQDVAAAIAGSLDRASPASRWRIDLSGAGAIGVIGIDAPTATLARLRPIGWRSLELLIAIDPRWWGRGLAAEALEAVAGYAREDGVSFALLAGVDAPNTRSHRLMSRCGFGVLGHVPGPKHELTVYERAL